MTENEVKKLALDCLREKRCMELIYKGYKRLVEVHTVGTNTAGHLAMRVYQVGGGSSSGKVEDWKMMLLSQVSAARITQKKSEAPKTDYHRDDQDFRIIDSQI
jgi:hypothetical protein